MAVVMGPCGKHLQNDALSLDRKMREVALRVEHCRCAVYPFQRIAHRLAAHRNAADVARMFLKDNRQQLGVVKQRTPAFRGRLYPRLGVMAGRDHRAERPAGGGGGEGGWRRAASERSARAPRLLKERSACRFTASATRSPARRGGDLTLGLYFLLSARAPDAPGTPASASRRAGSTTSTGPGARLFVGHKPAASTTVRWIRTPRPPSARTRRALQQRRGSRGGGSGGGDR